MTGTPALLCRRTVTCRKLVDVPTLARSGSSTLKPATGLWAGMALSMVMVPVGAVTVGLSLVGANKMV